MGKILVACEYSGIVRDAFLAMGHDAVSCDFLETDKPGPHYKGDVLDILYDGWDMLLAFPDCTYLTCSAEWAYKDGPYHQKVKPETLVGEARRAAREEALTFFNTLLDSPIKKKAIENPRGVVGTRIRKASQYIHPHEYGHDASKATGLWLEKLPPLTPIKRIQPRWICCGQMVDFVYGCLVCGGDNKPLPRWGNQTDSGQNKLTPSPDRWKERARTYPGIADAMAKQWGGLING